MLRTSSRWNGLVSTAVLVASAGLWGCGGKDPSETQDVGYRTETPPPAVIPVSTPDDQVTTTTVPALHPQVTYENAEAAYQARRYEDAVSLFTSYTEGRPENPWGHYMLGLSTWKAGHLAPSEKAFGRALELDPRHEKSLLNLSRVLLEAGRPQDAKPHLDAALALGSVGSETYRLVGRMESESGHPREAEVAYRQALVLDENDVWSMNNLGLLFIQEERFQEALLALARATELRPTSPVFQNNLGIALESLGQVNEARVAFGAAVNQDPSYGKASASLSRVQSQVEAPERGIVDLAACSLEFAHRITSWREEDERAALSGPTPDSTVVNLEGDTSPQ